MHRIAILGSGRVGSTLATKLASVGHDVTIGVRDATPAAAAWTGPPVTFASHSQAARKASIIINATPGDTSLERLGAMRDDLDGKILVDVSNAMGRGSDGMPAGLTYPGDSLAERLQRDLPGTRVVKTLNTMLYSVMTNPLVLGTPPTVFLSGDDEGAKSIVAGLLADLGWPAEWVENLGGIGTAQGPEAFMLLVPLIMRKHGFSPFALSIAR